MAEVNSLSLLNDANLQAYYRLEANGNDSSSNGYNLTGTVRGYVAGKFGNGADFEVTSSDYLSIANASCVNLRITGSMTASCWVKLESIPAGAVSFVNKVKGGSPYSGYTLDKVNATSKIRWYRSGLSTASIDSDEDITTGVWHHIAGVWDSSAGIQKLWIDGVKKQVTGVTGSGSDSGEDFSVGSSRGAGNFTDGIIDDAAVWNRALTDAEVLSLYKQGNNLQNII